MCPTLNISGKCPTSKRLLNILYKGKEIGVAINAINFPGTPQCDELDLVVSVTAEGNLKIYLKSKTIIK